MPHDLGGELAAHLLPSPPRAIGAAVSGGSDSIGLLCLLHDFSQTHGTDLHVVTVDHGLRADAAREAGVVADLCTDLNIPHTVLQWRGWDGQGNLQNEARRARYRLIAEWARARQLACVALGHTLDDQAETVLMRLARGSGVDGLSAMAPRRLADGITWLRPLLNVSRTNLQKDLKRRNVIWCDDPSNDDDRFDRVKIRQALAVLEPMGVTAKALGQVAFNMARARDALSWQAFLAARATVKIERGAVRINWNGYVTLPDEIARRILSGAICWISGAEYTPRRKAMLGLIESLKQNVSATAGGCQVSRDDDSLWIYRELSPVVDLTCPLEQTWDRRWRLEGPLPNDDVHVGALGHNGLRQFCSWRTLDVPRDVLSTTPAVWNGSDLISAPLAGFGNGWYAKPEIDDEAFFAALLSH
ncbi:MAG: tRNA lysidine(34) synthetase TilS [Paracoccaceae bacterium]|nr:tRNA lysidine(34) synthetase TilS [Paracoccaceae bacterium]